MPNEDFDALLPAGLRYDVARQLQKQLEAMGITGSLTARWAGLPMVSTTAKPAITPLIGEIQGQALPEDFAPALQSGKPASAAWSWNPNEQFATPNGAACFNKGGSTSYAHGGHHRDQLEEPPLQPGGERRNDRHDSRPTQRSRWRPLSGHYGQAGRRWRRPPAGGR